ncbi:MAG: YlmC/YmxH family sporulation protein [Ruminococcus sp.]|nr:YlmC/YmxH family sporulation protein [Ruminococcus sp.]
MITSFSAIRNKEIVNVRNGMKIGYADDIELDTSSAAIVSIIVYGRARAFGLMGRDDDMIIRCSDIELIGEDMILVDLEEKVKSTTNSSCRVDNLLKTSK